MRTNIIVAAVMLMVAAVLAGCSGQKDVPQDPPMMVEIGQYDILADPSVDSSMVTVMGVKLGDTLDTAVSLLGEPDHLGIEYLSEGILNAEYRESIGLKDTGVIFHSENNNITRITMFTPFNKYLKGTTGINMTKEDIYGRFGLPDKQTDTVFHRSFLYEERGYEFFTSKKQQVAFSLVAPVSKSGSSG